MKQEQATLEKILMGHEAPIRIFIYDMNEESKATQAFSEFRAKRSKFYLGRIDVPFSFLIAIPSVSGLFRLQRPLITYGFGVRRAGLFDLENEEEQSKT